MATMKGKRMMHISRAEVAVLKAAVIQYIQQGALTAAEEDFADDLYDRLCRLQTKFSQPSKEG